MNIESNVLEKLGQAPAGKGPLLDIRDLYVEYLTRRGPAKAVDNVSFSIQPGEVFGLAGESGCGKSTIAHTILRVLKPPAVITGGQILFDGEDVLKMNDRQLENFRWRKVSMVFQSAMNALNPVITVGEQVTDVILRHNKVSKKEAYERAAELLKIVGIEPERLKSFPHQMSGGMRQRVVIAIALALKPAMMIMDEPTTALDVVVQKDILQQIQQLKETMGFSILFITHDVSLMVEFSDYMAIMYAGEIVEKAASKEIFTNPIHPYTQGLLSSFPSLTGKKRKLSGIPGSPPDLVNPPKGCKFHPRCTRCTHRETEVAPQLTEVLPGHWVAVHAGMPLPAGND
ncbi:MAG: ABC transporter ATP-binding protein [Anaerolineales bacterium]|jgi:peptide/nickel transport system ATP-binding protein|nr:ABC transporter ATP-binding protein [Anaerolineales bacterium]